MNNSIKIYIASHKKFEKPKYDYYIPIRVGAKINNDDFGYIRDDNGENISNKNKNYCELTGLYWIWKNDNSNIVGLTHYRRYFFESSFSNKLSNVVSDNKITKLLTKNDIILPLPFTMWSSTVLKQYKDTHYLKDLQLCGEIIKEMYPNYFNSYNKIMNKHYYYNCNMIICKKQILDEYSKWLFSILFELEKRVDISSYDNYQARIFGFLSERLLNVWIDYSNYKIKELPVYNVDDKFCGQFINMIKGKIKRFYFDKFFK